MSFIDNLRQFVKNDSNATPQIDDSYQKSMLAREIIELVEKIDGINSFETSIISLKGVTIKQLLRRDKSDLQQLKDTLERKVPILQQRIKKSEEQNKVLQDSLWTGKKPSTLTDRDFDRLQCKEDR